MKIGILLYPTFGGSGVVATELGKQLANNGCEVHFISYSMPVRLDRFHENIFYHEVSITSYPLFEYVPYETILASKVVDIVKSQKLDLLHAHYAIPHASAALMAKAILKDEGIDIPLVTTLHGTDITLVGRNQTYKPVVEYSINNSDAITAVSNSLKIDTIRIFNIKKEISVIPNFIEVKELPNEQSHFCKSIAPNHEKILIHTSNFRKVKRVEDVLQIFNSVQKQISSKLLLIGDGPERDNIESLCRTLNLCGHVIFLGKQEAVEDILPFGDLFLLPSETESFGLAALEAMACGMPVISSNTGGIPEVNMDGVTGFLCAVGDIKSMADKAILLLQNDSLLQQFKLNARNQAANFSPKNAVDLYTKIYENLVYKHSKVQLP
jgi:N-acetyl-alpha-D-glucosaminyl L-malate synthase BshA